jgi:hypothetical protein
MAKFNEILVGRFNRALQKLLSMKGGPPSAQLATEITPNIQFNSMGQDFRALEDWYRFGIAFQVAANAANQSAVRLRNPPNSNKIVVIEKLSFGVTVLSTLSVESQTINTDLATVNPIASNVSWDKRKNSGSVVISSLTNVAPAALSLGREFVELLASTSWNSITTDNQEIILSPGEALQVRTVVNNVLLDVTFWWRERFFEESEATA